MKILTHSGWKSLTEESLQEDASQKHYDKYREHNEKANDEFIRGSELKAAHHRKEAMKHENAYWKSLPNPPKEKDRNLEFYDDSEEHPFK